MALGILIASVVVQILAAIVAIRLCCRHPYRSSFLAAFAMGLMAVRRGFTLVTAIDVDRAIDPGTETIELLISALLLGGLLGLQRRFSRVPIGLEPQGNDDRAHHRLGTTATTIGVLAALGSTVVGMYAYQASRRAVVTGVQRNMLRLAESLAGLAESHLTGDNVESAIATLQDHWDAFGQSGAGSELCIVRQSGEVVLDTASPQNVGKNVSQRLLTVAQGREVSMGEIGERQQSVTGWATLPDGRRQIAAMAFSRPLRCLVCLHVPISDVEVNVRAAAVPWVLGLGLTMVVLLPISLYLFHRAFATSQRLIEAKNRELAEREERLRRIVEHMPVMMDALDEHGNIVLWNPECERVTGYAPDDIIGNAQAWELLYPDPEYREELLKEWLQTEERRRDWECRTTCKDGNVRIIAWSDCPMPFPVAEWTRWRVGIDITRRREAELATRGNMAQIARLERLRSLGELASGIAHEINQPLTAIANYAQGGLRRLDSGGLDEAGLQTVMTEIASQTYRAADIIKRLRTFVGGGAPQPERADLNEIVQTVAALFEPEAQLRKIEISLELFSALPPVMVERVQIQQVLVNLMQNAVNAMLDCEPQRRRIRVTTAPAPDNFVRASVRDFGCGLDEKALEFARDPFFTTESDRFGMGLAVSRSIIEAHDGTLSVDPDCEVGAVFSFTLPAIERSE